MDMNLTKDRLLALIAPAALHGPPGFAEKLLASYRMARYEVVYVACAPQEEEWLTRQTT